MCPLDQNKWKIQSREYMNRWRFNTTCSLVQQRTSTDSTFTRPIHSVQSLSGCAPRRAPLRHRSRRTGERALHLQMVWLDHFATGATPPRFCQCTHFLTLYVQITRWNLLFHSLGQPSLVDVLRHWAIERVCEREIPLYLLYSLFTLVDVTVAVTSQVFFVVVVFILLNDFLWNFT